ncbi:uncharacterized protein LY89DRAFT_239122 [Mollisia scopiformis]|uniref:Uncharacterized protein n=1 Tax=Mollisia scopiformis TaxID=149040 RepID=A0A194WT93_MOLSC|nr:uncharacterized protein LY89DRAFT_239122 [Mollisia scopiformis]KUJ11175.1 hypothetical protein LY89DRAFT_239122 [Mollisia scopiformis]
MSETDAHNQFPFITTCLATAFWRFTAETSDQASLVDTHSLRMRSYDELTQICPGAGVIDVTDLSKLRYCYLKDTVKPMPASELHLEMQEIEGIVNLDLIGSRDLNSLWPGSWANDLAEDDVLDRPKLATNTSVPKLRATALAATIDRLLSARRDELSLIIDSVNIFPGFWPAFKDRLYASPDLATNSKNVGALLNIALANDK